MGGVEDARRGLFGRSLFVRAPTHPKPAGSHATDRTASALVNGPTRSDRVRESDLRPRHPAVRRLEAPPRRRPPERPSPRSHRRPRVADVLPDSRLTIGSDLDSDERARCFHPSSDHSRPPLLEAVHPNAQTQRVGHVRVERRKDDRSLRFLRAVADRQMRRRQVVGARWVHEQRPPVRQEDESRVGRKGGLGPLPTAGQHAPRLFVTVRVPGPLRRARTAYGERTVPEPEHLARILEASQRDEARVSRVPAVDDRAPPRLAAYEAERPHFIPARCQGAIEAERERVTTRRIERKGGADVLDECAVARAHPRQRSVSRHECGAVLQGPSVFDGARQRSRTERPHRSVDARAVAGRRRKPAFGYGRSVRGPRGPGELARSAVGPHVPPLHLPRFVQPADRDRFGQGDDVARLDGEIQRVPGGARVVGHEHAAQVRDGHRPPGVQRGNSADVRRCGERPQSDRRSGARVEPQQTSLRRPQVNAVEADEKLSDRRGGGEKSARRSEPCLRAPNVRSDAE